MTTTVRLTYFGMDGEGRTMKDAKLDAGSKIESLVREVCTPKTLRVGNTTAIIWRDAWGWGYGFLNDQQGEGDCICSHHSATLEECQRACREHLAQNVLDQDEYTTVESLPEWLTDKTSRREVCTYFEWQRAARYAQSLGLNPNAVHAWACEHQHEFRGITTTEYQARVLAMAGLPLTSVA